MIITFVNKKLKQYANDNKMAIKKLGPARAKKFLMRLDDIAAIESFSDLEYLPGKYHQLKENRKDQWACDLDQPYRLIFEPGINPIPKDKDGKQILNEIKILDIIEIVNYHKEK